MPSRRKYLQLVSMLTLPGLLFATATAAQNHYATANSPTDTDGSGQWIIDPAKPGPDIPPIGRSLFDHFFTQRSDDATDYNIPYPFTDLLDALRQKLDPDYPETLHHIMIPLGRSLHKNAAGPDYFRFPREVVAVRGEPLVGANEAGIYLRDMMYLGYQERADTIEVISYNDQAARFEFQVITDYAPGRQPRVAYANRALCTSCHQNGAPIFAESPWQETIANDEILARIKSARPGYQMNLARRERLDLVWRVHVASYLANYFSAYQLIWTEACGANTGISQQQAYACRAALFEAVIKYRLTGSGYLDSDAQKYADDYKNTARQNWTLRWPRGLMVATASIPDRNPLGTAVDPSGDPLLPRPPQANWPQADDIVLDGAVTWLAKFISQVDIQRLDDFLFQQAINTQAKTHTYRSECQIYQSNSAQPDFNIVCDADPDTPNSLALNGRVWHEHGALRGIAYQIATPEFAELRLLNLQPSSLDNEPAAGRFRFDLAIKGSNRMHARNADGNALASLEIDRRDNGTGKARLLVIEDYHPLRQAIARMRQNGAQSLSAQPFQRGRLMPALFAALGMPTYQWCCIEAEAYPTAQVETPSPTSTSSEPTIAPHISTLHTHCAGCHAGSGPSPPGFLHGDQRQVQKQIHQCSPRILYRLALWQLDASERPRSPMPPIHSLAPRDWPQGVEFDELKQWLASMLGNQQNEDWLLRQNFAQLPDCLSPMNNLSSNEH